jgi:hypothetical protein
MRKDPSEDPAEGGPTETRWAAEPERIDPDDYPPLRPYAKVLTWTCCSACALQVHVLATQFLLAGVTCPTCGARLLEPPEDGSERLRALLRQEDELSEQIE